MRKILLYHVFPINNWRYVTQNLISNVPHDDIYIHVSLNQKLNFSKDELCAILESFKKVKHIFFSENSIHAEVDAMELFRNNIDLSKYSMLTYMHCKGVTKPDNQNIKDWIELMRYFIIDKMHLCSAAFHRGYLLYGVNKTRVSKNDVDFSGASFFYAGNFVSVKLTQDIINKIKSTPLPKTYYGLEGFWGKLCASNLAYNAFNSRINHYLTPFPESYYKNNWSRLKYRIVAFCYQKYFQMKNLVISKFKRKGNF